MLPACRKRRAQSILSRVKTQPGAPGIYLAYCGVKTLHVTVQVVGLVSRLPRGSDRSHDHDWN